MFGDVLGSQQTYQLKSDWIDFLKNKRWICLLYLGTVVAELLLRDMGQWVAYLSAEYTFGNGGGGGMCIMLYEENQHRGL